MPLAPGLRRRRAVWPRASDDRQRPPRLARTDLHLVPGRRRQRREAGPRRRLDQAFVGVPPGDSVRPRRKPREVDPAFTNARQALERLKDDE